MEKKIQEMIQDSYMSRMDTNIFSQYIIHPSKWCSNMYTISEPTTASTLYGCQGSTFNKICIDMAISDSPALWKSTNLT